MPNLVPHPILSNSCLHVQAINLQIKLRNETSSHRQTHGQIIDRHLYALMHAHIQIAF